MRNKALPKPRTPLNPRRERGTPPQPEKQSPPPDRETKGKLGVRLQVMHGTLPKGLTIESRPDGDWFVWDGNTEPHPISYVSLRIDIGYQRGGGKRA